MSHLIGQISEKGGRFEICQKMTVANTTGVDEIAKGENMSEKRRELRAEL